MAPIANYEAQYKALEALFEDLPHPTAQSIELDMGDSLVMANQLSVFLHNLFTQLRERTMTRHRDEYQMLNATVAMLRPLRKRTRKEISAESKEDGTSSSFL